MRRAAHLALVEEEGGRGRRAKKAKRPTAEDRNAAMVPGEVEPATANQRRAFRAWDDGKHLLLHGCAGTGKTLIAMYLAVREVVEDRAHGRVVVVRSAVPTRSQGFLPGNLKEKAAIYEMPFAGACTDIYGRSDAYGVLKQKGHVEFITTSYVRGMTLHDAVIVVDEVQNMSFHEVSSIITRVGRNSRLILMGDFRQSDLRGEERRGVHDLLAVARRMGSFEMVEFTHDDILRSDVVKEFIVARDELGIVE